MVELRPFKGIQYSKEKIEDMDKVITQPYDKISDQMQEKYYEKSEYNYCKLILPMEENRYEIAAQRLNEWMEENVLQKEEDAGIYVYYQDYEVLGEKYTRKGFVSAVKLYPFDEEVVLPHEETHEGPKIDRLKMLRETEKNLEAGFMLYNDEEEKTTIDLFDEVTEKEPLYEGTDDLGVHSRVWKIEDEQKIKKVQEVLKDEQVVIADGHHRYETAVNYRDEMREKNPDYQENEAFNWRMTYMVPVEDPGLNVLPGHRLLLKEKVEQEHLEELEKYFEMKEIADGEEEEFLKENDDTSSFVLYDGKRTFGLRLKSLEKIDKFLSDDYSEDYKKLDVVVLRDVIFHGVMGLEELHIDEDISYERWAEDSMEKIENGEAEVAFLVNATKPQEVLNVAKNGERMPQKSTDFYPKIDSGFMMMDIQGGETL
ncbi:MAG: DUF1015 domain-containing protein [Candidatus Thermoplasmatota archaeon]|nr:DUF1015 domain-containing protein [Candidatus Thermoplasmatota archaeon]